MFTVAKDRLDNKGKELQKPLESDAVTFFKEARVLYLADVDSDHALSPETKRYRHYRVEALLNSWPGLDNLKLAKITERDCRDCLKRFSDKFETTNVNNTLAALRNILTRGGLGT